VFLIQIDHRIQINVAIWLSLFDIDLVLQHVVDHIQQLFLIEWNQEYDDDLIEFPNQTMLYHL
jgi:hypothetical protein